MKRAFLDKLLARLRRVRPEEVEAFFVELARDKRFLETIFNAIREGVIVTDVAGTVIYLNDAACMIFGLDAASALGRPLARRPGPGPLRIREERPRPSGPRRRVPAGGR